MNVLLRTVLLSLFSLIAMIIIDYLIAERAEFLNAYTVMQRLLGRESSFGISLVAETYGELGELLAVLIINLLIGFLLALVSIKLSRS